jgi:hypothetical protein
MEECHFVHLGMSVAMFVKVHKLTYRTPQETLFQHYSTPPYLLYIALNPLWPLYITLLQRPRMKND